MESTVYNRICREYHNEPGTADDKRHHIQIRGPSRLNRHHNRPGHQYLRGNRTHFQTGFRSGN